MDPTMNEHGSQGQSAAGSELLLGMHGFVGGQSQSSGRAPGLQHAAFVSRGWRRIEVKTTEAHSVRSPSGVRRSGAGVGGSVIDPGAGYDSAGGYYSRDVSYRPWMEDEKRSSQPSHSWGPWRGESWRDDAQTLGKGEEGGKGRAGCCAAQRTHANEQPLARPAGQPREGRQNFRASHIPRGRPRVAGWVKVRGTRCRDGQVDGSSEEFQVSCLGCGVSRFDAGSARARPSNATQPGERRWHAARRTPGEALQLRCNFNPAKQDDWATPLAFVPPEIGSTHAQERSTDESRLGTFPATVGKPSWLGVLAPNLVMADQDCIPSREHYSTQSSILVQPLLGCNYRAEALGSDQQPFPDDDDAPPRRSCRPRTRTLRFRPRIASSLVSDIPLSTELRRGKFQMPAKLHPGVEVHGDAKTATGSERHDSGSRISMNPRGTSTPAPAPAPAQAQTG
ncbi:hypothetical protein BGZ57DRAFT_850389 [Hyaloscypha finlandica]|nr:hypothetical protein BGZ57DRAFT_850389 [Hyaloscypha finlandica]